MASNPFQRLRLIYFLFFGCVLAAGRVGYSQSKAIDKLGRTCVSIAPTPKKIKGVKSWQIVPKAPRGFGSHVDWSKDGRWIAVAEASYVKIFDAATRKLARVVGIGGAFVNRVAWAPKTGWLAIGLEDGQVQIWDDQWQLRHSIAAHEGPVRALAWNRIGESLASGGQDSKVKVWNKNGEAIQVLYGHSKAVSDLSWSANLQSVVASSSEDATIRVWHLGTDRIQVIKHSSPVQALAWGPDVRSLASGDANAIQIWFPNGRLRKSIAVGRSIQSLAWSSDGSKLAIGSDAGTARIYTPDGKLRTVMRVDSWMFVTSVAMSPDDKRFVAVLHDGSTQLMNIETGQSESLESQSDRNLIDSVAWKPDGTRLVAGGSDIYVRMFDATGNQLWEHKEGDYAITQLSWRHDGAMFSSSGDKVVRIWSPLGKILRRIELGRHIRSAAWSPNDSRLVTAGSDGIVRLWNNAKEPVVEMPGHDRTVYRLAWSPDGKRIASAGRDRTIRIWSSSGGEQENIVKSANTVWSVAWHPKDHWLAAGGFDRMVSFFSLNGKLGPTIKTAAKIRGLHWNRNGSDLAIATYDEFRYNDKLRFADAQGKELPDNAIDVGPSLSVRWAPNSKHLAVAGFDGMLRVVDYTTAKIRWTSVFLKGGKSATFAADGTLLAGDPKIVDRDFVVMIQRDDGRCENISYSALGLAP